MPATISLYSWVLKSYRCWSADPMKVLTAAQVNYSFHILAVGRNGARGGSVYPHVIFQPTSLAKSFHARYILCTTHALVDPRLRAIIRVTAEYHLCACAIISRRVERNTCLGINVFVLHVFFPRANRTISDRRYRFAGCLCRIEFVPSSFYDKCHIVCNTGIVESLVDSAADKSEAARHAVVKALVDIGRNKHVTVLGICHSYLKKHNKVIDGVV